MAKSTGQKLKILYLLKILSESTDELHPMPMKRILEELSRYDISAERKTVYTDIEDLKQFGYDILRNPSKSEGGYYMASRDFELPELKLLVDAVQSSKFITVKKSHDLINKLEYLTSRYEAKQLQRQVYVAERVKTMNESIYYNVDTIHTAINDNRVITFHYYQWNIDKKMELRHGGKRYKVSPWALTWAEENYYLIGYDAEVNRVKHYRVDKMLHIEVGVEARTGQECFDEFDMVAYSKRIFGMFDGKTESVKLECENRFAGIIIDRFGKDVMFIKVDETHFITNVDVAVSDHFLAWVIALGNGVRIVSPDDVVERMRRRVKELGNVYGE